jgi:hypothetical protein
MPPRACATGTSQHIKKMTTPCLATAIKLARPIDHGRCPPRKALQKSRQGKLKQLINTGKIEITKTADIEYIKKVRHDHFRHQDSNNFRQNFCSYARFQELKDHLSGYRQEQGGGKVFILSLNLFHDYFLRLPLPPLSLNFRPRG